MNKKNYSIELIRFVAALTIMCGHISVVFSNGNIERPFKGTWFYVEFFFLVTAYFTVKHFDKERYYASSLEEKAKESIAYTANKFKRFFVYTTVPIVLMYVVTNREILQDQGLMPYIKAFENMPFELLYLSAGTIESTRLFPLWFLSAMLIVFPVFCILAQIKNRRIVCILAAYISLFYYLSKYDFGSHIYPNQIIRAFSAMMLGYLVYHIATALDQRQVTKRERFLLSIIEVVTMLVPLGLSAWNIVLLRIYLICFVLYLTITLSNKSWLSQFSNPFILFLGKLSMPVYVWHYVVGVMLEAYMPNEISINFKIGAYYSLTLLIATINLLIAEKLWIGKKKNEV